MKHSMVGGAGILCGIYEGNSTGNFALSCIRKSIVHSNISLGRKFARFSHIYCTFQLSKLYQEIENFFRCIRTLFVCFPLIINENIEY